MSQQQLIICIAPHHMFTKHQTLGIILSILFLATLFWAVHLIWRFFGKYTGLRSPKYMGKCGNVQFMLLNFPFLCQFHLTNKLHDYSVKKTDEQIKVIQTDTDPLQIYANIKKINSIICTAITIESAQSCLASPSTISKHQKQIGTAIYQHS